MTWVPTNPGLEEARADALAAFYVSKLPDLNTTLARPGFYNTTSLVLPVTEAMVQTGNTFTAFEMPQPMSIRVSNGDYFDGEDFEAELYSIVSGNSGWRYRFCTHVYICIHPDLFAGQGTTAAQQSSDRERCLNRIADWLTFETNFWNPSTLTGGTFLPLESSVIGQPYDILKEVMVTRSQRVWMSMDMGGNTLYPTLKVRIESKQD